MFRYVTMLKLPHT